ncbi:hypothetical protein GCM10027277_49980 [Pseudoduganella ginsengisoli]|uniref:Hemerythrin-like domain-containing protein n=1 Tax=Pseudoduganella ginsengisoli TaxID=1462440 RepID=A0A6L6Q524_9BURK|nr:hemerythrin family protein [Pseudoduganella ginsengisoli]MTW04616.1 hypothetical protein [Pseudoduganella ginsengisoli]
MEQQCLPADMVLGEPTLDTAHGKTFAALVNTLALPEDQFMAAYGDVVDGIETDFRYEEQLMESFQCPDAALHRAQHARMLAGLHHAESALMQGDADPAHRALRALVDWLPFHIVTQDRHLLRMVRQGNGAAPVPAY